MINFLFAYIVRYALVPGRVENWSIILDCKDVWTTEIPTDKIRPMLDVLMTHYNARMFRFYAINIGFIGR